MKIQYDKSIVDKTTDLVTDDIEEFADKFQPVEKTLYVMLDKCTNAVFCECHISADTLLKLCTVDVPLDPEEQSDYRANRELVEDSSAFLQMKADAKKGRVFSNIVAEYNTDFDEEHPLKIVGGQHRIKAISEALSEGISEYHGVKIYFNLNIEQRLDVQLISNTNIAVSSDLLDRMMETVKGPELRDWCHKVGLLDEKSDFADKKQRGNSITVREARTFIINYYRGLNVKDFAKEKTDGIIAKTGGIDEEWENLKVENPDLWENKKLQKAGKEFARLVIKQKEYYSEDGRNTSREYADKAFNYAVLAAWAFVAGLLENNTVRLSRHFELPENSKKDPLNAEALATARHKSDPENYRGLGTRTDAKERGRLIELFYLQAENGKGINKSLINLALSKYFAKQANLEVMKAEQRIK
ncbi:hypothetical protein DXB97_03625 [Firmicutes bacterium OM07-11]|nr:hypothetical protein DXB97_03625 [Firmicutes bacterium OM07-11]